MRVDLVNKFFEGESMPDQFEQLKQKYQPVLTKIQEEGAELQNLNLDGNQLFLKATAVSEASKNRIWDAIKAVDPNFADLKHDIEVRQGEQSYTVTARGQSFQNQPALLRRCQQVSRHRQSQQPG